MRYAALAMGLGVVLAACASSEDWVRPGAPPAAAAQALSTCRSEASAMTREQTKVDANIMVDRQAGSAGQFGQGLDRTLDRDRAAYTQDKLYDAAVESCMRLRGFVRTST